MTLEVPRLSFAESVMHLERPAGGSGRKPLVRREQNSGLLMTHLINKFCPPGETVLDVCMETGSTVKACLLAPKDFKFFGCEADNSYLSKSVNFILEAFLGQIFDDDSAINESEEIQETASQYIQGMSFAGETKLTCVLKTPRRVHSVPAFPNHIVFMFSQDVEDIELFLHRNHLPCIVWSEKRVSRLNSVEVRSLLSHECSDYSIHIKPSTVAHPQAGMGCFANRFSTRGNVIGYYYGMPLYQFFVDAFNYRGIHGKGVRADTREQFHTSVKRLAKVISSLYGILHTVSLL